MFNMMKDVNGDAQELLVVTSRLEEGLKMVSQTEDVPYTDLLEAASHYVAGAKAMLQRGVEVDAIGTMTPILAALDGFANNPSMRGLMQKAASAQGGDVTNYIMQLVAKPRNPEETKAQTVLTRMGNSQQLADIKQKYEQIFTQASIASDPQQKEEAKRTGLQYLGKLDSGVREVMTQAGMSDKKDKQFDWHKQNHGNEAGYNPRG